MQTNNQLSHFFSSWQQMNALIAASMSIKSSGKLKKILEVSSETFSENSSRCLSHVPLLEPAVM